MKSWQAEVFIFGKRLTNHTGVKDGKRTHTLTLSFSNTRTALASRRPLVTAMTGKVYMTAHRVIVDYSLIQHKSGKKQKQKSIKNVDMTVRNLYIYIYKAILKDYQQGSI